MKVVEYWHGTIKNYRYDGDVSSGPKKGINRLTGGPRGSGARPGGGARPLPRASLGHRLAWIFLPIFFEYSKNNLRPFLSRLDSV